MDGSQSSDKREDDDATAPEAPQAPADQGVGSGAPGGESSEGEDGGKYASGDTYSGTEN